MIFNTLKKYINNKNKSEILVPGCGLGRLVYELYSRGYQVEGNEFSY